MFRKVNKQPGMQKFWNWCSHYQEIYDWISPLNKRAGSAYNTIVYGGKMSMGESGPFWPHSVYFHSFEALNDAFEVQFFQGFIFTPYQRHWYHLGPCSSDFFKVKNCLNNAFKTKINNHFVSKGPHWTNMGTWFTMWASVFVVVFSSIACFL